METATYPLPDGLKIRNILGLLFDDIEVLPGGQLDSSPGSGSYIGVYVGDAGAPLALCASDASLSAYWASALSMLPVSLAREAAKSRQLTGPMLENLREIMNICTRLVMNDRLPHLRLDDVYPADSLPAAAVALVSAAKGRRDYHVALPKYGSGQFALMSS